MQLMCVRQLFKMTGYVLDKLIVNYNAWVVWRQTVWKEQDESFVVFDVSYFTLKVRLFLPFIDHFCMVSFMKEKETLVGTLV